jgi:hypothetical protein
MMPRLLRASCDFVRLAAPLIGALLAAPSRAAEPPANPLRSSSEPLSAVRIRLGDEDAASRRARAASLAEEPAESGSVVPPQFGQPELLPAPSSPAAISSSEPFHAAYFDDSAWDHLVHPLFAEPWFSHSDPNDPRRHVGIGQPLIGTSWRNRPWYFGAFLGGVMMDDLTSDGIYQNDTTLVGARLGFDFDHYWGLEGRWAFARPDLADAAGEPINPASRDNFGDVSLVVYPLGDARWRPYFSAGLGFVTYRFNEQPGQRVSEAVVTMPLGFGVKYFYGPWFTLRFDFTDHWSLGNDRVSDMHNVSLTAGAEFRFGGRKPSYFPWHNNTAYW